MEANTESGKQLDEVICKILNQSTRYVVNSVGTEKRSSRSQISLIEINLILGSSDKISLKDASALIGVITRIICKKMKNLLDDCNHLLNSLNINKTVRNTKNDTRRNQKNITLNIENICINDGMITFDEDLVVKQLEDSLIDQEAPIFDLDMPSIEIVRDSTIVSNNEVEQARDSILTSSSIFNDTTLNINVKRRKIVEDATIEISQNIFTSNLRNVTDILMKPTTVSIPDSLLCIDTRIVEYFESLKKQDSNNQVDSFVPEFDIGDNEFNGSIENNNVAISEVDKSLISTAIENSNLFLDLEHLPSYFNFNSKVEEMDNYSKASNFLDLLKAASNGTITAYQETPFGPIVCSKNKEQLP